MVTTSVIGATTEAAVDIIERVLVEHHTATVAVTLADDTGDGDDEARYSWACLCGDKPKQGTPLTDHAAAWRAGHHHTTTAIVAALTSAA